MTRTTTAHLHSIIKDINQLQPHADGRYSLDTNAGGYRLTYDKDVGGSADCTDRVSLGELYRICFGIRKVLERGRR